MTPDELQRYDRHLRLPEVGLEGQQKLKSSKVLLIGSGGLGSPVALYLAAAGVGTLGLVDFDQVDSSNLQRQVLHGSKDLGRPKVESARDRLLDLNPYLRVQIYDTQLKAANALALVKDYDIVVDGSDNFSTRYLVSDACTILGKPYVYGSIYRFEGQVSLFHPAADAPCYRCLHPEPPPPGLSPSCAEAGVLGVLPGVIGCLQATETLKWLLGIGQSLAGRLLMFDALALKFREIKIRPNPICPGCSPGANPQLVDLAAYCPAGPSLTPGQFLEAWQEGWRPLLIDVRQPEEWAVDNLEAYGAQLVPLEQIHNLELHPEVLVYCQSGGRSARAQQELLNRGFAKVVNLSGGLSRWRRENEGQAG